MKMLEIAVAYAEAGALVLPLHTPTVTAADLDAAGALDGRVQCSCSGKDCENWGKHPRVMRGKDDATSDVAEVERWWRMWPQANIAIRPHPGHVVLDVDPRHGGDVQLQAMQAQYGRLPTTRTAATGGGGVHLWFALQSDVRGELAPGIDVKTHSGYVVVPPSLHAWGTRYGWINDGPVVAAPSYLAALLRRPERAPRTTTSPTVTAAAVEGLVRKVRTAPTGQRNDILNWAVFHASRKGVDLEPLIDAAVENGLSRREAERTADSAVRGARKAEVT